MHGKAEEHTATEAGAGQAYKSTPKKVEPETQFIDCC